MIDDRNRQMPVAMLIRLRQQITAPDAIEGDRTRHAMLQCPSCAEELILVCSAGVCDVGLAHRHLSACGPAPIEMMGNRSAARLRHEGFQVKDFLLHPARFRLDRLRACARSVRDDRSASPSTHDRPPTSPPCPEPVPQPQHTRAEPMPAPLHRTLRLH